MVNGAALVFPSWMNENKTIWVLGLNRLAELLEIRKPLFMVYVHSTGAEPTGYGNPQKDI